MDISDPPWAQANFPPPFHVHYHINKSRRSGCEKRISREPAEGLLTTWTLSGPRFLHRLWPSDADNFLLHTLTSAYTRKDQLLHLLSLCGIRASFIRIKWQGGGLGESCERPPSQI